MPDKTVVSVVWTDRALQNASSIKKYLAIKFSQKEVAHFFSLIRTFEIAVSIFPKLYPHSGFKKNIRRAVLSKVLSAYYRVSKNQVEVLALLDNRCDISKWL